MNPEKTPKKNIPEYATIAPNRARRQNVPTREPPPQLSFDEMYDNHLKNRRAIIRRMNPNFSKDIIPASYDPNNINHYKYLRPTRFNTTQSNHGLQPNPNDLYLENMDLMTPDEKDDEKVMTQWSGQKMAINRPPKKLIR